MKHEMEHIRKLITIEQLVIIIKADIKELIDAAKPFLSGDIVVETSGTIPLMERLEEAIERAEKI